MSSSKILAIIPIYIPCTDALEDCSQIFRTHLYKQMQMITHKAVSVNLALAYCFDIFQYLYKFLIVFFIFKYLLSVNTLGIIW